MVHLRPFLRLALLQLVDEVLSAIHLFNQLVLEVDHTTFQLLELKAILALHLLLGYLEHLGEVALENVDTFAFLTDYALQAVLRGT